MKERARSHNPETMLHLRRTLVQLGLLATTLLAVGCLEPTLPLPPPARPEVSPPDSSGIATVRGKVRGSTTAMVENLANGEIRGKVTDDTGLFTITIPAESNDRLVVYYIEALRRSQTTVVLVPYPDEMENAGGAGGQGPED
jgi:hypothetical protein